MFLVFFLVGVPELSSLGVERARAKELLARTVGTLRCGFVLLVRFTQQTLQTKENTLHVVDGTPLVLQDVQTDTAGEVDIRVVDGSFE